MADIEKDLTEPRADTGEPREPRDPREFGEPREPREPRRGSAGMLFAVALIVLGGVALMTNMGIATVNWGEVLRYWPVLLILVGLDIAIGRGSVAGSAIMALITVGALLGVFWLSAQVPNTGSSGSLFSSGKQVSGTIDQPLDGARELEVEVYLTQMSLTLGQLEQGSTQAAQGDWTTGERIAPKVSYEVDDGIGILTIRQPDFNGVGFPPLAVDSRMTLNLPTGIPIHLTTHSDLGSETIDLSAMQITALDASSNSGNIDLTMPGSGQISDVEIKTDLGSVEMRTPDKATLNIDTLDVGSDSGNVTVELPGTGTIGELTVHSDLGAVKVNLPDNSSLNLGEVNIGSNSGNVTVELPSQGVAESVTIECDLGAITVTINGETNSFKVNTFDVSASSGNVTVTLPAQGNYPANIKADLGAITVFIPASLEVQLSINSSLARPDVSSGRLKSIGDADWETAGYSEGKNRALVHIEAGSGNVNVKDSNQ